MPGFSWVMETWGYGRRWAKSIPRPSSSCAGIKKTLNVMDAKSHKDQTEVKRHLNAMMYADSREQALKERKKFECAFRHNPKGAKDGGGELGAADDLLRLPPRALEALANLKRGGVAVLAGAAENHRIETIQIAGQRHLPDLENLDDR